MSISTLTVAQRGVTFCHASLERGCLWLPMVLILTTGLMANAPLARGDQADAALRQAVEAFLYEQTRAQGAEVVIRVQPPIAALPDCIAPQPFLPRPSQSLAGRVTVGVRCGRDGQRVRYLQAEVERYGHYPVLKQAVSAGTPITADMLQLQQGNLSALPHGAVREAEALIGQVARRAVAAGVPLQQRQFQARALVKRGQQVVVEARGSHFRASREGTALESGGAGDQVRVRLPNRALIQATVVGEARLVVDF